MSRYIYIFFCCFCLSVTGYSKTIKAESSVVAIKKLLKRHNKPLSLRQICKSIDKNISSTNFWNEELSDTTFFCIHADWDWRVSVCVKNYVFTFDYVKDKGIKTAVYDYSNSVDVYFEKIKQWDVELFSSWKEYPKGCFSAEYQTYYRVIRKKKNVYEYSSYSFYDYSHLYIFSGPIYPMPKCVFSYYYK